MQTVKKCLLDEGYLERHFEQLKQQMERDRDNHKVQQLSQQRGELECRIDTALEMLMDRRIPQQERIISKLQQVIYETVKSIYHVGILWPYFGQKIVQKPSKKELQKCDRFGVDF